MSEYQFPCPNCTQALTVADVEAGRSVPCPTCKQKIIVPPRAPATPPPLPASARLPALPPPIPQWRQSILPAVSEFEQQVLEGGRFVVFHYCVSVLVMTFKRPSAVFFLRSGEDGAGHAWTYSLISLVAGWWGIPWGPIWTLATVINNARGGKDVTEALLTAKVGPDRAREILARRAPPVRASSGLRKLQWALAGAGVLLVVSLLVLIIGVIASPDATRTAPIADSGRARFESASHQIDVYHDRIGFGNSPKAIAVANRFSGQFKKLRNVFFEGGDASGISVAHHEFLTHCELQPGRCVILVHVPELRRFSASAKESLGRLAWVTAQQALQAEEAGQPGMEVAVAVRGFVLYDRVLTGTFALDSTTNQPSKVVAGARAQETLFSWFE